MGTPVQQTVRYPYIDQLKGFSMLLVIIGHLILFCGLTDGNILVETIVLINMPLFLFLNGLVIKDLMNVKWGGVILKKFRQIMIPFFVWGGLITLFRDETYHNFLTNYWKFGYWYLLVLFELFIIVAMVGGISRLVGKKLNRNKQNVLIVSLLFVCYIALRGMVRFIPANVTIVTDYYQLLEYFPYFSLGLIIHQLKLTDLLKKYIGIIITSSLILGIVGYIFWINGMSSEIGIIVLRLDVILFMYALFISYSMEKSDSRTESVSLSILSTIGKHTLSIYMLQFFFFRYINFEDLYSYLISTDNTIILIAFTTISAILISYLCMAIENIINKSVYLRFLIGK